MNIDPSLFEDITFLDDYQLQANLTEGNSSTKATIKGSHQRVIISKIYFESKMNQRFKGIILADSIFLVQEGSHVFAYIVSVELEECVKFQSLKQFAKRSSEDQLITIIKSIVTLVQKVHEKGESCLNLKAQNVILDSNKNVFLSPYILDQGDFLQNIKTQQLPYDRSYLCPQLIEKLFQKRDGRLKVGKKLLQKNDYWTLGCLILETFVLETPPFLAIDALYQQSFYLKLDQLLNQWEIYVPISLRGLLYNSLNIKPEERNLQMQNKKLNERSNCSLIIQLIKLTNPQSKQELEITVHLSSKFTFYISPKQNDRFIQIDKTITLNDTQQNIERIISNPITISLKQRSNKSSIFINIGALILREQGVRVWREPIISSYSIPETKSRLKIKCEYRSPSQPLVEQAQIIQTERVENQILKQKKAISANENKINVYQVKSLSKNGNKFISQELDQPGPKNNLSINQITQYIDKLKEQFTKDSRKPNFDER